VSHNRTKIPSPLVAATDLVSLVLVLVVLTVLALPIPLDANWQTASRRDYDHQSDHRYEQG
jgi:hypothetical protein